MVGHLIQPDAVVLDQGLVRGAQIETADGVVRAIHFDRGGEATHVEGTLLPGLVDLQVNGAGGRSVQEATPQALDQVAKVSALHGGIAFLPTLITAPFDDLLRQVRGVADWIEARVANPEDEAAEPLGIHVEGPFLVTPGAHPPECLVDPTLSRIEALLEAGRGRISLVTLAPSREGAAEAVAALREANVCVSLGHGSGTSGIAACVAAGAAKATHLFNAMGPWNHRDPGMVGTVLDSEALSCGLIADGIHVHEVWVRQAARCLGVERLVLVTDCASAMGMPDGDYQLSDMTVTLRDGAVRNKDGTLAGSALTMFEAGENYLRWVPEADAESLARVASWNPAALVGAQDRFGSIMVGRAARFALLRPDGTLTGLDVTGLDVTALDVTALDG